MAFFGRLGNLLRHAANRQISSELRSSPSFFQAVRCMSSAPSSKLFIGGVSYSTDEQSLKEAFDKYGQVREAKIIMDRETGRSRGFGFITYDTVEEASSALQALDGQDLHGRRVRVNYANERPRSFGGGGGGSYGGSYGGGSYGGSAGYGGDYGSSPYGGAPSGGGSYGGGGYGTGGNYGGGAGNDYSSPGSFGTSSGGGTFGDAGGVGSHESFTAGSGDNTGFASGGFDGGIGTNFGGGHDGSGGLEYGSSGQLDSKGSSNVGEDLGGFEDSADGNFKDDDDSDNFAKRA